MDASYDTSNFDTPDFFLEKVKEAIPHVRTAVKNRMKEKVLNGAGEDLLFRILELDPTKRRSAQESYTHRWVGGKTQNGRSNKFGFEPDKAHKIYKRFTHIRGCHTWQTNGISSRNRRKESRARKQKEADAAQILSSMKDCRKRQTRPMLHQKKCL